eukprot:57012-Eustigmatos_ZCMA.PRE.1
MVNSIEAAIEGCHFMNIGGSEKLRPYSFLDGARTQAPLHTCRAKRRLTSLDVSRASVARGHASRPGGARGKAPSTSRP